MVSSERHYIEAERCATPRGVPAVTFYPYLVGAVLACRDRCLSLAVDRLAFL